MQDIIARALALRNNSSSDLNSAVKAIQPLSEIVNYGAEYTYRYADYGNSELVKITADTQANNIIFITAADSKRITIQFWDANGRQNAYIAPLNGCTFITITNNDVISDENLQLNITFTVGLLGARYIYYNADGTFKSFKDSDIVRNNEVLTVYNRTEYTPTKDYHPATKKYVDDAIPTSLKNPYPLIFTGATSATYDGSESVTVDLPSGGNSETWQKVHEEVLGESVEKYTYALDNVKTTAIVFFPNKSFSGWTRVTVNNTDFPISNTVVNNFEAVYVIISVDEVLKLTAGKACILSPATYGPAASSFLPLLDIADITSITKIGTTTANMLTVGTKIIIYVKA